MLFEDQVRSDPRPAATEGVFEFLDRVDAPYWAAVRHALNAWFARYPAERRAELRERLFSEDQWQAAYWELLLHELYSAAGFAVEVHPPLEGSDRRPDFRIVDDETAFLLEARVVTATSAERRRRDRRLKTLIETINRTKPGNFYVKLDLVVEGRDQPPVGPVVADLEPWLAQLDPVAMDQAMRTQGLRGLPSREIVSGGWRLRFTPVPVDPGRRGKLTGPLIGLGPVQTSRSDPTAAIRKALGKKGRHYGAAARCCAGAGRDGRRDRRCRGRSLRQHGYRPVPPRERCRPTSLGRRLLERAPERRGTRGRRAEREDASPVERHRVRAARVAQPVGIKAVCRASPVEVDIR